MNIANKLTVLRMLLIPVFLFFFRAWPTETAGVARLTGISPETSRWLAIWVFAIAASTDFLDGYLARKLNLVTNFGKFLDPVADKMLVTAALIAMIPILDFPAWAVIIIVGRDIMISSFRMIASSENVVIAADMAGKIKTVLQMVMIIYLMWFDLWMRGQPLATDNLYFSMLATLLLLAVVVLTLWSAVSYLIKNRQVLKLNNM